MEKEQEKMKEITIEALARKEKGKEASKKIRRNGFIPAVVYGSEMKSLPLLVEGKGFLHILHSGEIGENVIINLNIKDGKEQEKKVLIRELQKDPVTGKVIHIDFQHISLTKKIKLNVPIHIVGTPAGVKDGGILQYVLRELEVECLPTEIPEKIEVDVSNLKIGDSIHVSDIPLEKVTILSDLRSSVVTVVPPTAFKEPEAAVVEEAKEPEVITEKKEGEEEEAGEKPEKEAKAEKSEKAVKAEKPEKAEKEEEKEKKKEKK
jgi:large subunit ribosomal protein L25